MTKLFGNSNKAGKFAFAGVLSSFFAEQSAWETIYTVIKATFAEIFVPLLELLSTLILTVYRWVLTLIDFCFLIIKQMGGLNTDFSSFETIIEGDIVFQFIFNDTVVDVIKGLFILAIVVILVFGIIAMIKSEFVAAIDSKNTGEIKNDKSAIWKRIAESFLLLVLVPVVFIGGFILSNAVLQTLINATTLRNNMSLGSQIFVASTYDANAYRLYAESNKKIPITYSFKQIHDYTAITEWDTTGTVEQIADAMEKYKQAEEWTQGYATFEMFYTDTFFDMDDIDYIQHKSPDGENIYWDLYDKGIKTYRYEYYVNADLQDYLMRYGETIHILTAEEAYRSCYNAGVRLDMAGSLATELSFYVNYADGEDAIKYTHISGSTDEAHGAVFLMCVEKEIIDVNGKSVYYYEPITSNNSKFKSDYLEDGKQYVVAKGFFDSGKYPTAIRTENGEVKFYRERLNVPTFSSLFPHISYELPAGSTEEPVTHVLKSAIQLFTGIDVNDFIPYVYFDADLTCLFTKSQVVISSLKTSSYYLDYSFTADGMDEEFIYNKLLINFVILVVASSLIVGKVLKAFFGLLKRAVDIMFLYLVYPAAVATIPLYEKSSFGNWVKQMTTKVLSLYGLIIGINLAMLLIPISMEVELFTAYDLQNTMLGAVPHASAHYLNILFQILFTLVGITFIFDTSKMVQEFVIPKSPDILSEGKKLTEGVESIYKSAGKVVTGAAIVESVKGITGYRDPNTGQYHTGWIPSSAFIGMRDQYAETKYGFDKNKEASEANKEANKQAIKQEIDKVKELKNKNSSKT